MPRCFRVGLVSLRVGLVLSLLALTFFQGVDRAGLSPGESESDAQRVRREQVLHAAKWLQQCAKRCRVVHKDVKKEFAAWDAGTFSLKELGTDMIVRDKPYGEGVDTTAGGWAPAYNETIDVIMVAVGADCVSYGNVLRVNELYKPNKILFITPNLAACRDTFANGTRSVTNLVCVAEEDAMVNRTSLKSFRPMIEGRQGVEVQLKHGRKVTAGWYYQQALKLSAMSSNSLAEKYGLSQHMRVLDNDMYVVHGFDWVDAQGRTIFDAISHPTGLRSYRNYGPLWSSLTGLPLVQPGQYGNLVAHGMTFYRPYVREMLLAMSPRELSEVADGGEGEEVGGGGGTGDDGRSSNLDPTEEALVDSGAWVQHAFSSICDKFLTQGFSEYWYYASWVLQRHPRHAVMRVPAAGCKKCGISLRPSMFDRSNRERCELMSQIRAAPQETSAGYVVLENHASEQQRRV